MVFTGQDTDRLQGLPESHVCDFRWQSGDRSFEKRKRPTVTENAVELVLRQESEPINSFLLVLAQLRLNLYRKYVLFDLAAVQKLRQELAFFFPLSEEFFRETGRVR